MARSYFAQDLRKVLNGLMKVTSANLADQQVKCETILRNSSILKASESVPDALRKNLPNDFGDVVDRASMVPRGILQFLEVAPGFIRGKPIDVGRHPFQTDLSDEVLTIREEDLEGIYLQSLGVEILQQNDDGKRYEEGLKSESLKFDTRGQHPITPLNPEVASRIASPLISTHIHQEFATTETTVSRRIGNAQREVIAPKSFMERSYQEQTKESLKFVKPLSTKKPTSQLSPTSKQRKVPATRISRLVTFGGLAAGLGIGTLTEITKRSLGLSDSKKGNALLETSPFLSEANAERIVDTLCRVRGAALKIGQILSIQDNSLMSDQLQRIFERVRNAADFMPAWQMEEMLSTNFGIGWRNKLKEFEDKPFAAASIGQVHIGKLHDNRTVAIKIQYPGVAQGIESDIDNLMSVLNVWNVLPEGIFIDKIVEVAKRELSWEVDYIREAKCAQKFRELLADHPDYYVPEVIDELSTKEVYTTELIEGTPVDKCETLDQESRDRICFLMLDLFFKELFEFQFMQTDPNWSNFLYNTETKQIGLLDFGASREYRNGFVDSYMKILEGAAESDREMVLQASKDIGFLTGYESKAMENAHIETVMILGEALRIGYDKYDFGSHNLTLKIQRLVPVMVKERLCPPPEEIYSLHRKLSGVFLLCSRLKGRVQCKPIFDRVHANYVIGRPDA